MKQVPQYLKRNLQQILLDYDCGYRKYPIKFSALQICRNCHWHQGEHNASHCPKYRKVMRIYDGRFSKINYFQPKLNNQHQVTWIITMLRLHGIQVCE